MKEKDRINRRAILKKAAGAAVGAIGFPYVVSSSVLGTGGSIAPSEKIVMGCIGVGGMGTGHLRSFLGFDEVRIAAVCDVFAGRRDRAKNTVDQRYGNSDCAAYNDFRELIARRDIDAVTVVTPDHWHGLIGLEAARNKKDMYYEKPMDVRLSVNKAIRDAVNRYGVVFQFGTQQRSTDKFRFAYELIRNKKLGELKTIMIGSADYDQIANQPIQPVPEGFDYNMWLGPAPWAPYTYERCTRNWTLIYDYSLGCVSGAWGIHHVDIAQWILDCDQTGPVEIEGSGYIPSEGLYDTPLEWEVVHKYKNGVKMIHMDMNTAKKRAEQFSLSWMGILFLGTSGWIYVSRDGVYAEPKSLLTAKPGPNELHLPRINDHRRNFLDCIKTRHKPVSHIEAAVRSDTVCLLDNAAIRLGRKLRWDPEKEIVINDEAANEMLDRPMRSPWRI